MLFNIAIKDEDGEQVLEAAALPILGDRLYIDNKEYLVLHRYWERDNGEESKIHCVCVVEWTNKYE